MKEQRAELTTKIDAVGTGLKEAWAESAKQRETLRTELKAEFTKQYDALGGELKEARAESAKRHDALRADFKSDLALLRERDLNHLGVRIDTLDERVGRMDKRVIERMNRMERQILEAVRGSSTTQAPAA